jgi:hypothetical protein
MTSHCSNTVYTYTLKDIKNSVTQKSKNITVPDLLQKFQAFQ